MIFYIAVMFAYYKTFAIVADWTLFDMSFVIAVPSAVDMPFAPVYVGFRIAVMFAFYKTFAIVALSAVDLFLFVEIDLLAVFMVFVVQHELALIGIF